MIPCALASCRRLFEPRQGGQKFHGAVCRKRASALRTRGGFRLPRGRPASIVSAALKIVAWAERRKAAVPEAWGVRLPRRRAGTGRLYDVVR